MSLCLPKGSANEHGSRHAIQTHERAGEFRGGDAINSHARRTPSMKATWRRHLIICLFLGLLVIPIHWLDQVALRPSGGNWITLDFRELLFWTYIIFLAIPRHPKFNCRRIISRVRNIARSLWFNGGFSDPACHRFRRLRKAPTAAIDGCL